MGIGSLYLLLNSVVDTINIIYCIDCSHMYIIVIIIPSFVWNVSVVRQIHIIVAEN